ncbi:MAG: asparaginase [Actinotalea sp.]|nr:asparaginase [Actinotalea sp.]
MLKLVLAHGGVDMTADEASFDVLRRACALAWAHDDAVDGVAAGIGALEDDPRFNAGYGSVLTSDGTVEVDAAVVDGRTGRYGAVAAVPGLRHPAAAAAELLRRDGPVLLSGLGALTFAEGMGHVAADLRTEEQVQVWREMQAGATPSRFTGRAPAPSSETVGCVVVDGGAAAVGSSTGGVCGKHPGRVGDSAILGAGLWADDRCAVLCSGQGEAMITLGLARGVSHKMAEGATVGEAVRWAVSYAAKERGAVAAVLAVGLADLTVAAAYNGASFPVMARTEGREWEVQAERV